MGIRSDALISAALILSGCLLAPSAVLAQNEAHVSATQRGIWWDTSGCRFNDVARIGTSDQVAAGAGTCEYDRSDGTYAASTSASSTKQGELRAAAAADGTSPTNFGAVASAGYSDQIVFELHEGASMPAEVLFTVILHGEYQNTENARTTARLTTTVPLGPYELGRTTDYGDIGMVSEMATYRFPASLPGLGWSGNRLTFGITMQLWVEAMVFNTSLGDYGASVADFGSTAGVQNVRLVDAAGASLTGQYTMTSASGRDYTVPVVAAVTTTPEPGTWALLGTGLLGLGLVGRRRRQVV